MFRERTEAFPLLDRAMSRHLRWAEDYQSNDDLGSAARALLDADAVAGELTGDDSDTSA